MCNRLRVSWWSPSSSNERPAPAANAHAVNPSLVLISIWSPRLCSPSRSQLIDSWSFEPEWVMWSRQKHWCTIISHQGRLKLHKSTHQDSSQVKVKSKFYFFRSILLHLVLQTRILAYLKISLSWIQTAFTMLDLYPTVPEMDDRTLFFSNHPSSTFWMDVLIHSYMRWHHWQCRRWFRVWCEGHSTVPPLLTQPVLCLHSQLFKPRSPSPRPSSWWLGGLQALTPDGCSCMLWIRG